MGGAQIYEAVPYPETEYPFTHDLPQLRKSGVQVAQWSKHGLIILRSYILKAFSTLSLIQVSYLEGPMLPHQNREDATTPGLDKDRT